MGKVVNPPGVDYECIAWSPVSDSALAETMGWRPPLSLRTLAAPDFTCTGRQVVEALQGGLLDQQQRSLDEMRAPDAEPKLAKAVETLDPTQLEGYNIVAEWSQQRCDWERAPGSASAPPL